MDIDTVFILGSGLMGAGIGQVCAQSGLEVTLCDTRPEALAKAVETIAWSVGKLSEKGKISSSPEAVMGRIATTDDYRAAAKAHLVIEAIYEDAAAKQEAFSKLDAVIAPGTIVASNTSAIPISELAPVLQSPEHFLGLHFFSPVPLMGAVEIIRGMLTSDETVAAGRRFVRRIGKKPVMVSRDVAGFVINRINYPAAIEAMQLVEQGVATVEDIDRGLRLAAGRKMGIFETGDMVGLDVTYNALMSMYRETGDARWFPPMILRRKVKAGHLGRKTGRGWYTYNPDGSRQ